MEAMACRTPSGSGFGLSAEGVVGIIGIASGLWLIGTGLMKPAQT
jgi:hypothetical protein